jgi:Asp/Glu/hydantoin racemase
MAEELVPQVVVTPDDAKTYSSDYVKVLREEAKQHRLSAKNYETHLRDVMGIDATVDITDLGGMVKNHKANTAKQLLDAQANSNNMLVRAEIVALGSAYDSKLVEKLLDKSKVTIEGGQVKGLKEAIAELEKEFPVIKTVTNPRDPGSNPKGARGASGTDEWSDIARSLV